MKKILALATYPAVLPRHGGQKRLAAFDDFYRSVGVEFYPVCVYDASSYGPGTIGPHDIPLAYVDRLRGDTPYIGDLQAGEYAARAPKAYGHFRDLISRLEPDAIQLEQPFMWPLVRRLRDEGELKGVRLIYSSHNWEPPLKGEILERVGINSDVCHKIVDEIEQMEVELSEAANAIIAVSKDDASVYDDLKLPGVPLYVIPNGIERRVLPSDWAMRECVKIFQNRRPLVFVGSAYPPNIEGFLNLVAFDGLFFTPPELSFAICGGVSDGIYQSSSYLRFVASNSRRVNFFPQISNNDLSAIQHISRGTLLPIQFGGGSNLKTAEALVNGKWIVATPQALRGFDAYRGRAGVLVAKTAIEFREAVVHAFSEEPPELSGEEKSDREALYWDRSFLSSGYIPFVGT